MVKDADYWLRKEIYEMRKMYYHYFLHYGGLIHDKI